MPEPPARKRPQSSATDSSSARKPKPTWQRWARRLIIAGVLYTLFGFLLLPLLIDAIATRQLAQQLDRTTVIERVRFNPYTFRIEIDGLRITDPDQETLLGWSRLTLNFEFTSIFHGPWRFAEITLIEPTIRVQINPDYTFNFSDLVSKFSAESGSPAPSEPRPLPPVWVDTLSIRDAGLRYADLTPSTPFRRSVQPVNLTLTHFNTLPAATNSLSLTGSTDAGEQFSWQGQFLFQPLELTGRLDLQGIQITNFAPFYADFIRLVPHGGEVSLQTEPTFRLTDTERDLSAARTQFTLQSLKVGLSDNDPNLFELDKLFVDIPYADAWKRQVEVAQVLIDGARARVQRAGDRTLDWAKATAPPPTNARPPGTALLVFDLVTNVMAVLSGSTNAADAKIDDITVSHSALSVLDEAPDRPVALELSDITAQVRDVSNLPDAAPTASLSLRWQTNGALHVTSSASVTPPSVVAEVDLQQWDLTALDPYLKDYVNVRLLGSELSFHGKAQLQAPPDTQPQGTFEGNLSLAKLHLIHALDNEDLLRWDLFRIDGIQANLQPLEATVEQIVFAQPEVWGTLNPDGTLNLMTAVNLNQPVITPAAETTNSAAPAEIAADPSPAPEAEPTDSQVANASLLPPVHLASVVLTNGTLHLLDRMSKPESRFTVNSLNGQLRGLSSTNIPAADFEFSGQIEPAGTFTLAGRLRPLHGPEALGMNLTTRGIDLTPTDPYAQRFLGYELNRGAVSTELSYGILNRQLQATNRVILEDLTLGEKVDSPDALKAPLKLGLAVLQDREGRIDLTVPVNGSLDDPQFEIRKVIVGAFANVFTKLVTSPFSVLGSMFGGKEDDLQRFPFPPGESKPPIDQQSRLQNLEKILYERPALTFQITGAADTAEDGAALKKQRLLAELSELRKQLITSGQTNWLSGPETIEPSTPVYARLVTEAYARAHGLALATTNTPSASPETRESPEPVAEPAEADAKTERLRPRRFLRGGERMMELSRDRRQGVATTEVQGSPSEPPDDEDATTVVPESEDFDAPLSAPPLPPLPTMEAFLLKRISITDQDLIDLAHSRAEQLRAGILASGRNEPDRIQVKTLEGRPPSGTSVRIDLQ